MDTSQVVGIGISLVSLLLPHWAKDMPRPLAAFGIMAGVCMIIIPAIPDEMRPTFIQACLYTIALGIFAATATWQFMSPKKETAKTPIEAAQTPQKSSAGLTEEQITQLRTALDLAGLPEENVIDISTEMGCTECAQMQNELAFALGGYRNLQVRTAIVFTGPTNTHPSGILLKGANVSDAKSLAGRVSAALTAAEIEHGRLEQAGKDGPPRIGIDIMVKRKF